MEFRNRTERRSRFDHTCRQLAPTRTASRGVVATNKQSATGGRASDTSAGVSWERCRRASESWGRQQTTASSANLCALHPILRHGAHIFFSRLSGFGPTAAGTEAPAKAVSGQPMRIVGLRWEQREFPGFYAEYASGIAPPASRPSCLGPIAYCGEGALHRDLANLKIATDVTGVKEAFVTSIAVGSLEMFCRGQNQHYPTVEAFLEGIASALRVEYRAIVDAGFLLQLDDPGPPDTWDMLDPQPSVEEYKRYAMLRVDALNHALAGIPEDRIRYLFAGAVGMAPIPPTFPYATLWT